MSRWWNEHIAVLDDMIGIPRLVFWSVVVTVLMSLALYFWPHWLPWRWRWRWSARRDRPARPGRYRQRGFRLGALRWRLRLRWRRRRRARGSAAEELPADQLPDLPAAVMALSADELAAQGRFAEAVRERLRAIVRQLIEHGVIAHVPGWTVTELAAAARRSRPGLAPPMRIAVDTFSEIWYGLRPAGADDDAAMRSCAADVTARLSVEEVAVR